MEDNFNVRDKKGAIAIFVLVGLLFMSAFLIISYGYNVNKSKIAKEQFNIISDIYSYKDGDAKAYERAYTALRKKNKQTLTKVVQNSSVMELEKTYEENLVSYRIYGAEEGVGDKVENLFDADDIVNKNSSTVSKIEFNGENCITWSQKNTVTTQRMLEGKFKENTIYYAKGSIALSLNMGKNPILFTVVYTDGSSEYINAKLIEDNTWVPGEFSECLLTMGNENKTISYIQGVHSNAESIYIKESTFEIIEKDFSWIDKYIQDEEYIIQVKSSGKNLVNIPDMSIKYTGFFQDYFPQNPTLLLKNNTQYTVSFDYVINSATTKVLCGIGYGTDMYSKDIVWGQAYPNQTKGHFECTFTTPSTFITSLPYLQFRFVRGNESGTFDVDISNVQVEFGDKATTYDMVQGGFETILYLDSPLKEEEYIDFKTRKVVRYDGTEEIIELPEIPTYEDYTKIEVISSKIPRRIEVEYVGYTLE